MDPFSILKISLNHDGSLTRHAAFPLSPATGDHPPDPSVPVVSKDVTLNPSHNTWIRIFLPVASPSPAVEKLPLVIYFHGGGFIFYSAASAPFHASCSSLAAAIPAAVLSVDYRLAPEHRLPAAYDDAVESLAWASAQARDPSASDPWLRGRVDFSRCFLMGSSSGGNIAYRAAILAGGLDLEPIKLAGLILNQPYFGGEQRMESELRMAEDRILPLLANDLMWDLALPIGANRDHQFCNPTGKEEEDEQNLTGLPIVLVRGYVGDPLIDRQRELARMLERRGVKVVAMVEEEGFHAVELFDSGKAAKLVKQVRDFVAGSGVGKHRL